MLLLTSMSGMTAEKFNSYACLVLPLFDLTSNHKEKEKSTVYQ